MLTQLQSKGVVR